MADAGAHMYIQTLEISNRISEPAIRKAISSLGLFKGCSILDVPCGIGNHSLWMAQENASIHVVAVDYSEDHLSYARDMHRSKGSPANVVFTKGDIKRIPFEDNAFDVVWCCDGIWPGPKESGCLCEQPYDILTDMARVTKPGGTVAILFWSAQRLLPGYPLLESALNNTLSANIPFTPETNPDMHIMRTPLWLQRTGLQDILTETFAADILGPLERDISVGMTRICNMFWGMAEGDVSPEVWRQFQRVTNPDSSVCIFNRKDYAGLLTYTMFTGRVAKQKNGTDNSRGVFMSPIRFW